MTPAIGPVPLTMRDHGAEHLRGAVADSLGDIREALAGLAAGQAGTRVHGLEPLRPLLSGTGSIGSIAVGMLGPHARAVRAILFDKTAATNWSLAWHQDRTICVRERAEVEGFHAWTIKNGLPHVAPPFDLLSRMVTLRVHLDDVPATNAPLLIAPGSHRYGRVPESAIDGIVRRCGRFACLAAAGDVWLYATLILHASEAATEPKRRRVLQIDFAAETLPGGLEWMGV